MTSNASVTQEKQRIREMIRERKTVMITDLAAMSQQVTQHIDALPFLQAVKKPAILYFVGKTLTREVQTLPHIKTLLKQGVEIWLPKTIVATKSLRWGKINNVETDLIPGAFSVLEPTEAIINANKIDFSHLSLVIVPGVAFDERGYRLGHGQGYYDRFLQSNGLPCPVVGIAFEFQVFPEISTESHDSKVDYIVTDKLTRKIQKH